MTYFVRSATMGMVPFVLFVVFVMCLLSRSAGPTFLLIFVAFANRQDEWQFLYDGPRARHIVRYWGIPVRSKAFPLKSDAAASSEEIPDSIGATYRPRWHRLLLSPDGAGDSFQLLRSNDLADVEHWIGLLNETIARVRARTTAQ